MKRIAKELADQMVMDVLVSISKLDDVSSGFAKDSLDIMNNAVDNTVFTGVLLTKARPSLFSDNEIDMKLTIMSALQTILNYKEEEEDEDFDFDFNEDLAKEFSVTDTDKCSNSTKLDFALNQFVNAFYEYERLEKKYPELMKVM
jgi:hypothetical protein